MGAQLVPGDHFGAYEIESELGRGGQAVVYRARQPGTERSVALKLFGEIEDEAKRARFAREAVAAARVEHPNIVPVYESGTVDGVPFLAMRLVPGPSLAEVISRVGPLPPHRALAILDDVAAAVDAAHDHKLVHRDIKAANVLLDVDDRAFLSDFGVARLEDLPRMTQHGDWLGTAEYMSPEQGEGRPATTHSDIYAFGVLAFEVLTGRPPFVHRKATAVVLAHVRDRPPTVRTLVPSLPGALDGVFATVLAKDPDARPPDARAVVQALRRALESAPAVARLGDTQVLPVDGAAGWTAVMRRISNDPGDAPRIAAAPETRVLGRGALPPTAPPASPAKHPPPAPRRGRRRAAMLAALVAVAGLSAVGTLYATTRDEADTAKARETAYRNGFRNGTARGHTKGVAEGRKAGYAEGLKKGTADGRAAGLAEGRTAGIAEGRKVPDASPGDFRVVHVQDDGTADYTGPVMATDSCFRINQDGEIIPISFASPFARC